MMKRQHAAALTAAIALSGCAGPLDDALFSDDSLDGRAGAAGPEADWLLRLDREHRLDRSSDDTTDESPDERPGERAAAPTDERAGHETIDESSTLEDLLTHAMRTHPRVDAAEARWVAARQQIVQAQTLPDPELSYRLGVEQIDTKQSPITHIIGLSQRMPWFGTLETAGDVAAAEARAAGQAYLAAQVAVVANVREAWAEYVYVHAAESIMADHVELLTQLESVVDTLYRTDRAGQADLVRVQNERDRVDNNRQDLAKLQRAAAAKLNAAIGRRADQPLPAPDALPADPVDIDETQLVEALSVMNPDLRRLDHAMRSRREAMRLADKQFYPDVTVGVEYGIDTGRRMARMGGGGDDMLAARLRVSLPIWRDSYEAASRQALAEWGAAVRDKADRRNSLEADLAMSLYKLGEAQRRIELYGETLAVRAEQVLESTETAYRTDNATFTDLIEAQRELLEFSLAAERARADRFQHLAKIEAIVGRSIDGQSQSEPHGGRQ